MVILRNYKTYIMENGYMDLDAGSYRRQMVDEIAEYSTNYE